MRNKAEIHADIYRKILSGMANNDDIHHIANNILSITELAIVDREAELPKTPEEVECWDVDGFIQGEMAMIRAGWLKEIVG